MVGGFNTNVRHLGRTFHVQTEDGGRESPQIITLLFEGGAILYSKKSHYELPSGSDSIGGLDERVRQLMEEQHRVIVESLTAGKFDSKLAEVVDGAGIAAKAASEREFGAGVITDKPLDELILEYVSAR